MFDHVTVLVAANAEKAPLLTSEERKSLIQSVAGRFKNVTVAVSDGLIVDYAREHGYGYVIRGLRAASDFEYEFMMAQMNRDLNADVETVFMMTAQNLFFVSSSVIKELHHYGSDISAYVPAAVAKKLKSMRHERQGRQT